MRKRDITIRHDIPGRLRLKIPGLNREDAFADQMERLRNHAGVILVRVNTGCSSVIFRYDPEVLARESLLDVIRGQFPATKGGEPGVRPASCSRHDGEHPDTAREFKRFAGISAVVGAVFVRTSILGGAVAQTLFSPVGLLALGFSIPLIRRGLRSIKEKRPNMDSFLAGGIIASLVGGEALTALEILWINSGADTLSAWIQERNRKHVSNILDITSHHTFVLENGIEIEREVSALKPGDVVVLHTGEKISVDGEVIHGEAMVNEAPMTGHEELAHRKDGDKVFAGSFVHEGVIRVRAENVGDRTYLARVMHKVEDALESRAPIEGVADRLAEKVVKLGFLSTAATLLLTGSVMRAYTVLLVMACPCATVLAASTAVSASMNAAARRQVLIKGGRYLEQMGKCETVFFDKTGTLTTTRPVLAETALAKGVEEKALLQLAASAETHNHHPLARAVMDEATRHGTYPIPHQECDYHMGMGMRAVLEGDEILVGNAKLALRYGADPCDLNGLGGDAAGFIKRGLTVLYVYKNKKLMGLMGFEAQERPRAKAAIRALREKGVRRVVLITGDEEATARNMAERLGMDEYHASVMPGQKGEIVRADAREHGPAIMVGDGINDALALTNAEVGVAFGTAGSEVAVEAADVALVRDDLRDLVTVYEQSKKTVRVAHQNFWIATGSNIVGVVLGAVGMLSPVTAGLLHIGHSLGVVANSARLLRLPESEIR